MPGLHELKPSQGSKSKRKRIGRGNASGHGTYAGRGLKGQKQRESVHPLFEGGQLPLIKRLPHMRGFTNLFQTRYVPINVGELNSFEPNTEVTPESLFKTRLIRKKNILVKILGTGEISNQLTVHAHAFSKIAVKKIEERGGKVVVIKQKSSKR